MAVGMPMVGGGLRVAVGIGVGDSAAGARNGCATNAIADGEGDSMALDLAGGAGSRVRIPKTIPAKSAPIPSNT